MDVEKRNRIRQFIAKWTNRGNEKSDTQKFWLDFLSDVLDVEKPGDIIDFEQSVVRKKADESPEKPKRRRKSFRRNTGFIDAFIPSTHVLIEQKSCDVDLNKKQRQSDGALLTPFEQAERYNNALPYHLKNKWIIICNFQEFHIYDMDVTPYNCVIVPLSDLESQAEKLSCIIDQTKDEIYQETELSIQAGELIGKLYDLLLAQYPDPENPKTLKSLNKLCVRLVFCLYAEDANIFHKDQFYEYLKNTKPEEIADELFELFGVLNAPSDKRRTSLKPKLKEFPYVNGGLFQDEDIDIPPFTEELKETLLKDCSRGFDWSGISPTIFGAVFESTLNPETRRAGGMHYTSIENIHKVIDPLFLDDLKNELRQIRLLADPAKRNARLIAFQKKLADLVFFDPACGSGNFLTETYICLRQMENDIIKARYGRDYKALKYNYAPILVSISNFYGIEINDFAVSVARTALWIAENQALRRTEDIIGETIPFLPLKSYAHIVEGNALRLDWEKVVPKDKLDYILGNPPFAGGRLMSEEQKQDLFGVFGSDWKNAGNLDYVCSWYKKAVDLIKGTDIHAAFVSTNSICQGEQVPALWKPLFEQGLQIDFAWRTFRWDSEAKIKAHVHCVIVGFSLQAVKDKKQKFVIYLEDGSAIVADSINPYLIDGPNSFIESRNMPICDVPRIGIGNKPIDDGNYLFKEEEKEEFVKQEPDSRKYFKKWYGSDEFINNRPRWCLWLGDCPPEEIRRMKRCLERVENVRQFRLASKSPGTRELAKTPTRFHVENMPKNSYILIPRVSSERRFYVPMGFMSPQVLCSDSVHLIPNATLYHFGVLTSSVHMAWMRAVCGRLEMRYRYSKEIVYNNFPWPDPTDEQRAKIEETAQAILDARAKDAKASLADLYDEASMPVGLQKAHKNNDRAVMKAYGFSSRMSEMTIVSKLMEMYQEIILE